MSKERVLIVGGGVSGLAMAGFLGKDFDCLLVEREPEVGGYCRTIYQDGFTWDYSGHFFHFQHKWVADYIHSRMNISDLLTVNRKSRIYFRNQYIDYPFQFNIHQLPLTDFVRCLTDMYEVSREKHDHFSSFREMVYSRYGKSISELFLIPYNEKLYSVSAQSLDADSMGRFFPHLDFGTLLDKVRASVEGNNLNTKTYNAQFCYHKKGARAYVDALSSYIPSGVVNVSTPCEAIDAQRKTAIIAGEKISYDRLVISAPLPSIIALTGKIVPEGVFTANKVLVFNLGFDKPSLHSDHWVYYPEQEWIFFRIGHYDNIFGEKRMSLYVEIAISQEKEVDIEATLPLVLTDLKKAGIIDDHKLVSWASVILDPAYVHVTTEGQKLANEACAKLREQNIYPIGRYGRWTYCSIEDNIVEAYQLAREWGCKANSFESNCIKDV